MNDFLKSKIKIMSLFLLIILMFLTLIVSTYLSERKNLLTKATDSNVSSYELNCIAIANCSTSSLSDPYDSCYLKKLEIGDSQKCTDLKNSCTDFTSCLSTSNSCDLPLSVKYCNFLSGATSPYGDTIITSKEVNAANCIKKQKCDLYFNDDAFCTTSRFNIVNTSYCDNIKNNYCATGANYSNCQISSSSTIQEIDECKAFNLILSNCYYYLSGSTTSASDIEYLNALKITPSVTPSTTPTATLTPTPTVTQDTNKYDSCLTYKECLNSSSNTTTISNPYSTSTITSITNSTNCTSPTDASYCETIQSECDIWQNCVDSGSTSCTTPTYPEYCAISNIESNKMNFLMKLKFQGITTKPTQILLWPVSITFKKKNNSSYKKTVVANFAVGDDGVWRSYFPISLDSGNYEILVKGPKHIQKKICSTSPTEDTGGAYVCGDNSISLTSSMVGKRTTLDFSAILNLTGDLPEQDGIVNSYDLALIRNNLGLSTVDALIVSDLNLDGVVNATDYALIIQALSIKTDEE